MVSVNHSLHALQYRVLLEYTILLAYFWFYLSSGVKRLQSLWEFWLAVMIRISVGFKCRHLSAVMFFGRKDDLLTRHLLLLSDYMTSQKLSCDFSNESNSKWRRFSITSTVGCLTNTVFWPLYGWTTSCLLAKHRKNKLTDLDTDTMVNTLMLHRNKEKKSLVQLTHTHTQIFSNTPV